MFCPQEEGIAPASTFCAKPLSRESEARVRYALSSFRESLAFRKIGRPVDRPCKSHERLTSGCSSHLELIADDFSLRNAGLSGGRFKPLRQVLGKTYSD